MKKIDKLIRKSGGMIACLALIAAKLSMTQACFILYHQPKVPDLLIEKSKRKGIC